MKRKSIKYATKKESLKNITENDSVKTYKFGTKKFADWAEKQGVKHIEQLKTEEERIAFVQEYQKWLDSQCYSPNTIHTYLAPVCKGMGFSMGKIKKTRRTAGHLKRSRDVSANLQGKREQEQDRFKRLVDAQKAIGIRRNELAHLVGSDLIKIENEGMYVRVKRGKGGKYQLQRILPEDEKKLEEIWKGIAPDQKVFTEKEMNNKIDLHAIRREHNQMAYKYYVDQIINIPGYKEKLQKDLCDRYWLYSKKNHNSEALKKWSEEIVYNDAPYELRGENKEKAIDAGVPTVYNRLALIAVSVYHLSHWRLSVAAVNYTA